MSPGAGLRKGAIVVHYGCVEVWEMGALGIKVSGFHVTQMTADP